MNATDGDQDPFAALQAKAVEVAALLKALAHPDRLMLLCQLSQGERCVAELGEATGVAQPSLSQQLGILRAEGLVATRREGKFIHYRVASEGVQVVLQALYGHYCGPAKPMNKKDEQRDD
ncbi:ArsR/SmtB family transcription factor [Ideonella paludis]|uniref:Helix-turn-helix transcriptional regulator n=1 Tax=Ideonella paludis TaxID=1233411 RepID=A0ABS5DXU2_9BURK|nr:metalloregulator ArsR/SmtB family transcription factor [Ideonella paludis]MBQ0935958.1 helix-turn-helix transcriptional regulator [Ideonella paludis]